MFGKSEDSRQYQQTTRPIVAMAINHDEDWSVPRHCHGRAQLVFAHRGVMTVATDIGRWIVPPSRAVWVPPHMFHAVEMPGRVQLRTVYFESWKVPHLPATCEVVVVTPLLRELILEAVQIPNDYPEQGREERIMQLIVDEIRALEVLPFELPMPKDPRALQIARRILENVSCAWPLSRWAREAHSSPRTVARAFLHDTGMTFGHWRLQARLQTSLTKLARGRSVIEAALDVGYESPSAFAAAFRRLYGVSPSQYFSELEVGGVGQ